MSITQGLFSDVLANAPGGGTADWSKTLPMAGAVDWAKVTPFQVINPLTGYNFGATQAAPAAEAAAEKAPELTEYQKWLAKQSQTYTSADRGGGNDNREAGWYERTTPEERAAFFAENPTMAGISRFGMETFGKIAPYGLASAQDKYSPGMREGYIAETYGLPGNRFADIASQMSVNGQGGFMAGPAPNQGMSLADQYAAYNSGRVAYNEGGGGTTAANDSYSGSPGGESSGGSYAGGDFGYSGADRGSYF